MNMLSAEITSFVITNKFGKSMTLVLELEGDCIELSEGQTCKIVPATPPATRLECEMVLGQNKSLTFYLSIVKEVYIDSIKVR